MVIHEESLRGHNVAEAIPRKRVWHTPPGYAAFYRRFTLLRSGQAIPPQYLPPYRLTLHAL